MADPKTHPDFDAAPSEQQWTGDLPKLVETLRHEAYQLKGDWAWRMLPRGALVGMCVPPTFHKQLRIARRLRKPLTDKTPEAWRREVAAFLKDLGCEDWKQVKDVIEPGDPPTLEAVYEELTPLGARRPLVCERCGEEAEPGSDKYKLTICNRCAVQLGEREIQERARARLETTR